MNGRILQYFIVTGDNPLEITPLEITPLPKILPEVTPDPRVLVSLRVTNMG